MDICIWLDGASGYSYFDHFYLYSCKQLLRKQSFSVSLTEAVYQTGLRWGREGEEKDTDVDCHVLSSRFVSLVISVVDHKIYSKQSNILHASPARVTQYLQDFFVILGRVKPASKCSD